MTGASPPAGPDHASLPIYTFDRNARIVKRHMPALELIHERFARTARLTLYNMVRRPIEFEVRPPEIKPYQVFVNGFPERTNIVLVNVRPLRGVGCWISDPEVVYLVIDNMFGGEGRLPPKVTSREYTATELRIIRRLTDNLLLEYEKAWKSVYELKFDVLRQENNFQFARIADADEMVLHCSFEVNINGRKGNLDFCVPFWVFEPIKTLLFSQMQAFQAEEDTGWGENLRSEVQSANVNMVATLAKRQGTLGEVLSFNVGDLLPIEVQEPVTVTVDGLPMIKGTYGVRNGRYAIKISSIDHPIALSKEPTERGLLGPQYRERSADAGEFSSDKGLP
jgi:flagellar motor switch protein FliM